MAQVFSVEEKAIIEECGLFDGWAVTKNHTGYYARHPDFAPDEVLGATTLESMIASAYRFYSETGSVPE